MFQKYRLLVGMLVGIFTFSSFATSLPDTEKGNNHIPWWVWILALFVLVFLLAWWWEQHEQVTASDTNRLQGTQQETKPASNNKTQVDGAPKTELAGIATPLSPMAVSPVSEQLDQSPSESVAPAVKTVAASTEERLPAAETTPESAIPVAAANVPAVSKEKVIEPDNLKKIEGIGPKIASVLNEAGIMTFQQLADTDVETLRSILDAPRFRLADPSTWPEQAALAAKGAWEALKTLQEDLKGGRRG